MRLGKHTFTTAAWIELGVAAVLAVVGLVLGFSAWGDYTLYGGFRTALRAQAAGRFQDAFPALEPIATQQPAYPFPAELAAKLRVDGGNETSLKQGLRLYDWLRAGGYGNLPAVRLGTAAAHLRLGDILKGEQAQEWGEAARALDGVSWPEAKILHAHLLLRQRSVAGAERELKAAYEEALGGKEVTLEGLVDLYVGLGVCASRNNQPREAARMFRRAHQLMPTARIPFLNTIAATARRYVEEPTPREEILEGYEALIRRARDVWRREYERNPENFRGVDRAVFHFFLAVGWALTRHNLVEPHAIRVFMDAGDTFPSIADADKVRKDLAIAAACMTQLGRAEVTEGEKIAHRNRAQSALDRALRIAADPKLKALVQDAMSRLAGAAPSPGGTKP